MFSTKEKLAKRTGETGTGRYEYLKQLINEFTTTKSHDSKRQTLANLANFAYDPINYQFFRQLHLPDLFLAELSNNHEDLIAFSLGALCNLAPAPEFREYIISLNGIHLISQYLCHTNEDISLNSLVTLYYLYDGPSVVPSPEIIAKVKLYQTGPDNRFKNLSQAFLNKYQ